MNPLASQVLVMPAETSRHEGWEDAIERACTVSGTKRENLWQRDTDRGVFLFAGRPQRGQFPIAWIADPVEHRRASSAGELENFRSFFTSRAGAGTPARPNNAKQTAMSKAQKTKNATPGAEQEPATIVYHVETEVVWHAKRYRPGSLLTAAAGAKDHKLELYLRKEWIRVATPEDVQRANAAAVQRSTAPIVATIDDRSEPGGEGSFRLLDPRTIAPGPVNPRRMFADGPMQELTDSVREKGVRVPINVRAMPAGVWFTEEGEEAGEKGWLLYDRRRLVGEDRANYVHIPPELFQHFFPTEDAAAAAIPLWEIIAGERRWRASKYAGRETIRAVVEVLDDIEAAEIQVIENDQREDLTPIESAGGYNFLLSQPGYTMEMLIQRTGKSKTTIYDRLQLLKLPKIAQEAVAAGRLPMSTAQLIGAVDEDLRETAAEIILGFRNHGGQRFAFGDEDDAPVKSYRDAERSIQALEREKAEKLQREIVEAELKRNGVKVLTDAEARKVTNWGSEVAHNGGHVGAKDVCPHDPKGRTWEKVLKGAEGVEHRAVIIQRHNAAPSALLVFEREEANQALKKAGLWNSEGSGAAKKKIEKQEKQKEIAKDAERMGADLDAIVSAAAIAENGQMRAVLLGTLRAMIDRLNDREFEKFLGERRGVEAHRVADWLDESAPKLKLSDLFGLVAEVCTYVIGGGLGQWSDHLSEGREIMMELLQIDAGAKPGKTIPDVRKAESEPAREPELALA